MFSFFYNCVLFFYVLLKLPSIGWNYFVKGKAFPQGLARLGLKDLCFSIPPNRPLFWVHAVSVGETKAAAPFVAKLKEEIPNCYILFSSITATGHEEAKKSIPQADERIFLPLDFSWVMKKLFRTIRPMGVILVEGDLWYHFLHQAHQVQAKICLISGKLSERSFRSFSFFSFFARRLFSQVDLFCLQSEEYYQRFLHLGIPVHRLKITGNLKYCQSVSLLSDEDRMKWAHQLGSGPWITVASTHHPEERDLLEEASLLWEKVPNAKLFLAPRHPERFSEVKALLQRKKISFCSLSDLSAFTGNERVLLIDCMGFLSTCYQLSQLAIVGGSFVEGIGGHNIWEPVSFQTPVFFGPYLLSQKELRSFVLRKGCGREVSEKELFPEIVRFLSDHEFSQSLKSHCKEIYEDKKILQETWREFSSFYFVADKSQR